MKKIFGSTMLMVACALALTSCKKADTTPITPITPIIPITPPAPKATIIFNDTITVEADSVYWDYYSTNLPRVRFIKNNLAIITLWPGTIATQTKALSKQYLYWIINNPTVYTVNSSGGTLTMNDSASVINGSLSATGDVWTGTGPAPTKVSATFSNVIQKTN